MGKAFDAARGKADRTSRTSALPDSSEAFSPRSTFPERNNFQLQLRGVAHLPGAFAFQDQFRLPLYQKWSRAMSDSGVCKGPSGMISVRM